MMLAFPKNKPNMILRLLHLFWIMHTLILLGALPKRDALYYFFLWPGSIPKKKAMMIQYLLNRIVHTWHSMKWLRQYICQMKNHGCHIGPTHETLFWLFLNIRGAQQSSFLKYLKKNHLFLAEKWSKTVQPSRNYTIFLILAPPLCSTPTQWVFNCKKNLLETLLSRSKVEKNNIYLLWLIVFHKINLYIDDDMIWLHKN